MASAEAPDSCVEIEALTVRLHGEEVLRDVTFSVQRGALHAVIGPNGAGKTTLFRALLGLLPFNGRISCHFRRNPAIGYVPQNIVVDRLLPLTVADFLMLAQPAGRLRIFGRRALDAGARGLLEELSLSHTVDRLMGDLSGGERQRVLVAQALLVEAELLLLDEPASAVDQVAFTQLQEALLRRCLRGVTVLWITHDLDWVKRTADHVTCLRGHVQFDGVAAEMLSGDRILAAFRRVPERHA